jgi:hypothetical protein
MHDRFSPTPCKLPAPERFVRNRKAKYTKMKPIFAVAYGNHQNEASDSSCKNQQSGQLCKNNGLIPSTDLFDLLLIAITVDDGM